MHFHSLFWSERPDASGTYPQQPGRVPRSSPAVCPAAARPAKPKEACYFHGTRKYPYSKTAPADPVGAGVLLRVFFAVNRNYGIGLKGSGAGYEELVIGRDIDYTRGEA